MHTHTGIKHVHVQYNLKTTYTLRKVTRAEEPATLGVGYYTPIIHEHGRKFSVVLAYSTNKIYLCDQ